MEAAATFDNKLELPHFDVSEFVRRVLAEDMGSGDVTTLATVPETAVSRGRIVARERLIVAGLDLAEAAAND